MPRARPFHQEQRRVAMGMFAALVVTIAVLASVAIADRTPPAPFAARLHSALLLELLVLPWLVATIANVARLRFFSEPDIAGSSEPASPRLREARAVLQNTLEQTVLAVATHLIVAASFPRSTAPIAALIALFGIGRLLFWRGYRHGAAARAFGFGLGFYPNVVALLAAGVAALP
jgi:hypothetical protein